MVKHSSVKLNQAQLAGKFLCPMKPLIARLSGYVSYGVVKL